MWRGWKPHTLLVETENGTASVENNLVVPQNAKHKFSMGPNNSILVIIFLWELKHRFIQKACIWVFIVTLSIIVRSGNNSSIKWWMDKPSVAYIYNGILLIDKNTWSTDTYYDLDKPWKYYVMGKKPDTKSHILYDSIFMKCLE